MDQGEALALGLALGFVLGWFVCWVQEEGYWRRKVQELRSFLAQENRTNVELAIQSDSWEQLAEELRLRLDLESEKIQELRSQLGTLLALELKQEKE